MVADPFQVARISFLEFQSVEIRRRGPLVSGIDEVLRNVDSHDVGPETGERRSGGFETTYLKVPGHHVSPPSIAWTTALKTFSSSSYAV